MKTLQRKLVQKSTYFFLVLSALFLSSFAKAQQYTAGFATAPTFYDGNNWNTKTHVLVPLNGVEYEVSIGQVSPWRHLSTGGHSNSGCINATGAGDVVVLLKRKDNAKFAFYGLWAKYTNYSNYQIKDLTVSYPGSTAASEAYVANTTVTLTKSMNVTSVSLYFRGLDQINLDNIIVGAAIPEAPTVSTSSINNFRNNAALMGGNVTADGGAAVTERGIVYNTTGTPTNADNKIVIGSGIGTFSGWTTGLNPNTLYYVRAYATNAIGTNYAGTTGSSFTTAGNFVLAGNHNFNSSWASTTSQPTPFTKYVEGWNVTASGTNSGNVSVSRIIGTGTSTSSALEGAASLRSQSATTGEQLNYLSVKANDGSAFLLKSLYTRYGTKTTGTSFGTLTVQGYKNGSAVSGATLSKVNIAENTSANNAYTFFDLSLISSFKNIDEFTISATNPVNSALLSYVDLDQLVIEAPVTAAPLTANISTQTNVSCNLGSNGAATVVANGGTTPYTYSWSPSGGTAATASGLQAGTYTVTVTDANAATTTATTTITQPSALSVNTSSQTNVSCNGGSNGSASVNVSGGAGSYSYSWFPAGGTNATAMGLTAGNYTVTITDANACTSTRNFTITQPTAITSTSSQTNVSCNGGSNGSASVNVSGGAGSYSYSWFPAGGTNATATGLTAGNYTVTITDANACTSTRNFTITQPTAITSTSSQTNVSCNGGSNGSASVSVSGGAGSYSYSWFPAGGTNASATGLTAGNYTVTITDANSCTSSRIFTITQPTAITSTTSQTNVSCNGGSNGSASVSVSGGAGSYSYSWSPAGGTNASATGLTAGNYTVTITDANSCTSSRIFTITQPTAITSTTSQTNVSCNGGTNGSASVSVSGGAGSYSYSWSPSGGTAASATGLTAGNYTVTITDANGCTSSRNFTITQPTAITSTSSQTNVSCNSGSNGSASVNVSGGAGSYSYSWSPSGGTAATATDLVAGNYTVTITDANGCTSSRNFTITQPTAFTLGAISGSSTFCAGSTTAFSNATSGGTWQSGNTSIATVNPNGVVTAIGVGNTTITYTATNTNGCTAETVKNITITDIPATPTYTASSSTVTAGQTGVGFSVTSPNATSFQWSYTGSGTTMYNDAAKDIQIDFALNATSGVLKTTAINSCGNSNVSEMTITVASPLPVTLTKFGASQKGKDVIATWSVSQELNVAFYEIERSSNGANYVKVGQVATTGNSTATYTFTDLKPAAATYNYRLKMIDKDGIYKYSKAAQVKLSFLNPLIKVLVNPVANHKLQLKVSDVAPGKYELNLISAKGQIILRQPVQYIDSPLMLSVKLPFVASGTYYVQLHNGSSTYNETVIVK